MNSGYFSNPLVEQPSVQFKRENCGVYMAGPNQDPLEEFEFRPINEGLGFHRKNKTQNLANTLTSRPTATTSHTVSPQVMTFNSPLPRNEVKTELRTGTFGNMDTIHNIEQKRNLNIPTIEDDSIAKAQSAVNEILKNLNQKRQIDFISDAEREAKIFKKSKPIMSAAGLDAMLITAAFLMTMIAMLSITKIDLFLNLSHPETSGLIYLATGLLFATVTFIYMVINRAFLGFTPGEWAYDQRCGQEADLQNLSYIPRLALRSLVVMLTGFITMPLLSYLFNKDMAGQLSGVNLYRKPNAI